MASPPPAGAAPAAATAASAAADAGAHAAGAAAAQGDEEGLRAQQLRKVVDKALDTVRRASEGTLFRQHVSGLDLQLHSLRAEGEERPKRVSPPCAHMCSGIRAIEPAQQAARDPLPLSTTRRRLIPPPPPRYPTLARAAAEEEETHGRRKGAHRYPRCYACSVRLR